MRKSIPAGLIVALIALTGAPSAQAKASANDNFAKATPIAVGQQVFGSNLGATAEANEPAPLPIVQSPNCTAVTDGPQCASSVWFTFQPSQAGQYTVETCDLGTDVDTVLGIYSGADIGSLVLIDKDDDGPGGTCGGGPSGSYGSQIAFNATAGTLYHLDLNGFLADQGSYYIRVYAGAPQARPTPDTHILRWNSFSSLTIGGAGAVTGPRNSASFALNSPTAGATFQCALDKSRFKRCGSVVSYDLAPNFPHTFKARAVVNGAVDPTPAVESFTIDAKAPKTSLASGPQGSTNDQSAQWVTAGTERNTSSGFRCSLDGQNPVTCGSTFKTSQLCQGAHTFHSAAYDPASNLDRTPLTVPITETAGPVCAAPTITPFSTPATATRANPFFGVDPKGAGGTVHLDYGTTNAYGTTNVDANVYPNSTSVGFTLLGLTPSTTYHYRGTITTPFGTASTPDQTFTTPPLTGTLPALSVGKPRVIGHHAARIPLTIDPAGTDTGYLLEFSAKGPALDGSPNSSALQDQIIKGTASGPQATELDLVDLPPAATIHYRVLASHNGGDGNWVASADSTFKVPPIPRFKLRKGLVSAGKLRRGSSKLRVKIHGLPDATAVNVKLSTGNGKSSKTRKRGGVDGKASFKLKLGPGVRKGLHDASFGFARLRITTLPPGQKRSHITLRLPLG